MAGEFFGGGLSGESLFKVGEDFAAAVDDRVGYAGELGDVDPVGFVGAAGEDFVQEDNLVLPFADGDV